MLVFSFYACFFILFIASILNDYYQKTYEKCILFCKFYIPISVNIGLFLFFYIIPLQSIETIIYSILIFCFLLIINSLTIQFIQKNISYNLKEMILDIFLYQIISIIFFIIDDNRSLIIEIMKTSYFVILLINTKNFTEINYRLNLLESSNQSFFKLFLFFNNNLMNYSIIQNNDKGELTTIFENNLYQFFMMNEVEKDDPLCKIVKSLNKIKANNNKTKNQDNYNNLPKKKVKSKFLYNNNKLNTIREKSKDDVFSEKQMSKELNSFKEKINSNLNENKFSKIQQNSFESVGVANQSNSESCINKIKINPSLKVKRMYISLIENYDYEYPENKLRNFIFEKFNNKEISIYDLIFYIITSDDIKSFCGIELGPFNAYFYIDTLIKSNSFLFSFKIEFLDFLKGINYIILLRDIEFFSKILDIDQKICLPKYDQYNDNNVSVEIEEEKNKSYKNKLSCKSSLKNSSVSLKFNNLSGVNSCISPQMLKLKDNYDISSNEISLKNANDLYIKKLDPSIPALIHDFKNLSIDFTNLISIIFLKIPENYRIQLKDELEDIIMLKSYMFGLIKMINEFSEGNGFLINSNPIEIDMAGLINLMIRIFNKRLEFENSIKGENQIKKNIKIHANIHPIEIGLLKRLIYNKDLITSLIYNIVSNSFKSTLSGEILLDLNTEKYNNQNCIVLSISDTGVGIPDHIFHNWGKPFNKDQKDRNSTGLGQFIINSIAKSLEIHIPKPESKINEGTKFKLFFTSNINNIVTSVKDNTSDSITINLNNDIDNKNSHNYSEKEIIFILLCDDSQICLSQLENYLKRKLVNYNHDIEYVIKKSSNVWEFLNEINLLLKLGQFFNFLIIDYNIGCDFTGLNLAKCAIDIYRNILPNSENQLKIFFLTEEINFYENNKNNTLVKKEMIFNKVSFNLLIEKLNSQ